MKNWLLILAMVIGSMAHSKTLTLDDVKFLKGEIVQVRWPLFYTLACASKATVVDVEIEKGKFYYLVETEHRPYQSCPNYISVAEFNLHKGN